MKAKKKVGEEFAIKLPEQMGTAVAHMVSLGYLNKKKKR